MLVRFEATDGSELGTLEKALNPSSLPRLIQADEGNFWFQGIAITKDVAFLPAYRLVREVSGAMH